MSRLFALAHLLINPAVKIVRPMENAASRSNRRETDGKGREERLAIASPNASLDSRNFSALQPLLQFSLITVHWAGVGAGGWSSMREKYYWLAGG